MRSDPRQQYRYQPGLSLLSDGRRHGLSAKNEPVLDERAGADIFAELESLCPAYTPELVPVAGGAESALFQIFARDMQTTIQRLNQAPDNARALALARETGLAWGSAPRLVDEQINHLGCGRGVYIRDPDGIAYEFFTAIP